jgi:metal-responsive CopG/Arc/MetJ family transcriptional regulator
MQTKKKITITIDEETCSAVDRATRELKMPRSRLAQEALSLWLKKQTENLMAQGYREMAEEDRRFSEMTLEAQREIQR